ncbi:MAG: matrixin family metalloprotease [Clostridiales bacterium]|nr:matrixin family metalloprotease [Clostridiales bacterium]
MIPIHAVDTNYVECSHGFSTYYDHVLNGGVGSYGNARRYYWIDPSVTNGYAEATRTAAYNWTYTTDQSPWYTTSISFRETSVKSQGTFEIHNERIENPTGIASTVRKLYQSVVDPYTQNWGWAYITLDESKMYYNSYYQNLGTITHEFGHAMGLAHCPDTGRIMCQLGSGRFVFKPQVYDCQTVNHLY